MDRKGRGTLILTTGLAGRRYQEKDNPEEQEMINEQLIPGAELKFERESENRYDPYFPVR